MLAYLKDPKFFDKIKEGRKVLTYSNKKEITTFARDLYIWLYQDDQPEAASEERQDCPQGNPTNEDSDSQEQGDAPPTKRSRQIRDEELSSILEDNERRGEDDGASSTNSVSTSVLNTLKADMKFFESRGQRSKMLAQIYRALLSIPPTSCEAERQ